MESKHRRARQRRLELKLTQLQVAKECRVTQQAYEKFERGETRRPRFIYELAKILQVSAEWLLTGKQAEAAATAAPAAIPAAAGKIPVFTFDDALRKHTGAEPFAARDMIDRVRPLPGAEDTADAIALCVEGNYFAPCYPDGAVIYLDRRKPPAPRKPCICLYAKGVEIFVFINTKGVVYNFKRMGSRKLISIKLSDIRAVYKIAGVIYP